MDTNPELLDSKTNMLAVTISAAVTVAYLLLYTMYSKKEKTLVLANLVEVLTFSKSVDHSLVELNKAISLSGLTTLCMPFWPGMSSQLRWDLLFVSMSMLWAHSCYSMFKYYGEKGNIPALETWGLKETIAEATSENSRQRIIAVSKANVLDKVNWKVNPNPLLTS